MSDTHMYTSPANGLSDVPVGSVGVGHNSSGAPMATAALLPMTINSNTLLMMPMAMRNCKEGRRGSAQEKDGRYGAANVWVGV